MSQSVHSHKVQFGASYFAFHSSILFCVRLYAVLLSPPLDLAMRPEKSDDTRVIWSSIDVSDVYMFDWTIHFIFIQFNFFLREAHIVRLLIKTRN